MTHTHPLDTFLRRFNSSHVLYKGYVFHGEAIMRATKPNKNIMMDDVSDVLMGLYNVGIITPLRFNPSFSGAALLGLSESQRRPHNHPHCGDAAHWDWEVTLGEYTFDIEPFEPTLTNGVKP